MGVVSEGFVLLVCFAWSSLLLYTVDGAENHHRGDGDWTWTSGSGNSPQVTQPQQKGPQSWQPPPSHPGRANKGWAGPSGGSPQQTWPSQSKDYEDGGSWQGFEQPQQNVKGSAYPQGGSGTGEGNLEAILKGVPGEDFPNFYVVPETAFDCNSQPTIGYYSDVEAGCQVFHICQPEGRKDSFLCPVGTIFNQKYFVCDWWFNVNCSDSTSYYDLNAEVYKEVEEEKAPVAPQVTTAAPKPWRPPAPPAGGSGKKSGGGPAQAKPPSSWGSVKGGSSWSQSRSEAASWSQANTWRKTEVHGDAASTWTDASVGTGGFKSNKRPGKSQMVTAKQGSIQKWPGPAAGVSKPQNKPGPPAVTGGGHKKYGGPPAPFGARMKPLQPSATTVSPGIWTPSSAAAIEPTTLRRGLSGRNYGGSGAQQGWFDAQSRQGSRVNAIATSIRPSGIRGVWEQESVNRDTPWTGDRGDYSYDYVNTLPSRISEYEVGNEWSLPTDSNLDYDAANLPWDPTYENEIATRSSEAPVEPEEPKIVVDERRGKKPSEEKWSEKSFKDYESEFLSSVSTTAATPSPVVPEKSASNSFVSVADPPSWGQRKRSAPRRAISKVYRT